MYDYIQQITKAYYSALAVDLPDIEGFKTDWSKANDPEYKNAKTDLPKIAYKRRPNESDITDVISFVQSWGSTALGFGGIGGAAITTAQTTVIVCQNHYAVYFGGRLAYMIECKSFGELEQFSKDLQGHGLASCREAMSRYKNIIKNCGVKY